MKQRPDHLVNEVEGDCTVTPVFSERKTRFLVAVPSHRRLLVFSLSRGGRRWIKGPQSPPPLKTYTHISVVL